MFVLSGPATVVTSVATASAFLADGWSTESVSRVVRTARTRQENIERERAEHAHYSHLHDEVTISDALSHRDSMEASTQQETQHQKMTKKMKQHNPCPTHCRQENKISRILENMEHPSN